MQFGASNDQSVRPTLQTQSISGMDLDEI